MFKMAEFSALGALFYWHLVLYYNRNTKDLRVCPQSRKLLTKVSTSEASQPAVLHQQELNVHEPG
jgi:hypothetical protein